MRLVLLGDPVEQSRSPVIHEAALQACGIAGSYEVRRVDRLGLRAAIDEVRTGELDGANVTMPHKAEAARIVDRIEGPARRIGAVNTVLRRNGEVVGINTDVGGVGDAWRSAGLPDAAPVLILGGGGAALAAAVALEERRLVAATRAPGGGVRSLAAIGIESDGLEWGEALPGAVVVNATPIGMGGERLPAGVLEVASGLFDMAYGAVATPAVTAADTAGIPVADGLDLLVAQAAHAFSAWTGRVAPIDVMSVSARGDR